MTDHRWDIPPVPVFRELDAGVDMATYVDVEFEFPLEDHTFADVLLDLGFDVD